MGVKVSALPAAASAAATDELPANQSGTSRKVTLSQMLESAALLAGRSGGQTLIGGTGSGDDLTLQSSSHGTKGSLLFGTSAYDEVNNRLGIGLTAPSVPLDVKGSGLFYDSTATSGSTTLTARAGDGQGSTPILQVLRADGNTSPSNCAIFELAGTQMQFSSSFIAVHDATIYMQTSNIRCSSGSIISWNSAGTGTGASADVAVGRKSAGVLEVNSGSASAFRDVFVRAPFITKVSAPADGELAASQVALWFDDSNGAAKLKIKGKSADGTVVTGEVVLA